MFKKLFHNFINKIPKNKYIIIIGAAKCGTSTLFNSMSTHSQICPSFVKEPTFFLDKQRKGLNLKNYDDLWHSKKRNYFEIKKHKYVLEASTGYTKYPQQKNVPEKIYKYGIKPKFIYLVRNPFDRILSHYNFRAMNKKRYTDIYDDEFVDISNYFLQLEQYNDYFPKEDIFIADFDDLSNNPREQLANIYKFLGLSSKNIPESLEIKNSYNIAKSNLERKKPENISELTKKEFLTDKEKKYFHNKLHKDMLLFEKTYGFDVSKWGFER